MFRATKPLCQHHIQTAIIGAGVIGLAVGRALSKKGHEVLILEQATSIGSETSSRNSEVIHAGIYYDRNIMPYKSKFCVEGKQLLYQYCIERDIPFKQCGKLLVATDADQNENVLPQLIQCGKGNGVDDLRIVSKEDIADPYSDVYEPNVECKGAVYSPSTGIIDSHSFMQSMLAEAEENGATLALNCRVDGGRAADQNVILTVDGSDIVCDNVIICAGLHSHNIAFDIYLQTNQQSSADKQNEALITRQYYAKGNYYALQNQKEPFSRLVYPLPDPQGGLGVHATIDLSGSTKFGPDVEWIDDSVTNPADIDMNVDPSRAESFYAAIRKYWPHLNDGNLVADYSGIRPKLWHPSKKNKNDNALKDFFIATQMHHGVHGLHVLLGIESPGLTSSLAIGNHMAKMID